MLERLLESKVRRSRSLSGAPTSVTAHVAVVVMAIYATAQSKPLPPPPTRLVFLPYIAAPTKPVREGERRHGEAPAPMPRIPGPISFDPKIPPIDLAPPSPTDRSDFMAGGVTASPVSGTEPAGSNPSTTFRADQVERQVAILPGAPLPRYPEALRDAGIEGRVVAQFIVDERGTVDADSVRFVQSDNELFEESVRSVLKRMRFTPAEIGGRRVRQLVQMPFVFTIGVK